MLDEWQLKSSSVVNVIAVITMAYILFVSVNWQQTTTSSTGKKKPSRWQKFLWWMGDRCEYCGGKKNIYSIKKASCKDCGKVDF